MKDYKKYRWFYSSSGKLVLGGKNAKQNDELLLEIKEMKRDFYVLHTSHPGSPFCVIFSDFKKVNKSDLKEAAVFTGCFSNAWKEGKKKTEVDIFKSSQMSKKGIRKEGMWKVFSKIRRVRVKLKLVLVKQKNVLRAVPEKTALKKKVFMEICHGKVEKNDLCERIMIVSKNKFSRDEILSALPAGSFGSCL